MSPWIIRQFFHSQLFDEGRRDAVPFREVAHAFRDKLCDDADDLPRGPTSQVEPLTVRTRKFLKLINLHPGQMLSYADAMNWTRPVLKKIAMLADPPHDTMRELLDDKLGFPLSWSQSDGTESGPQTRLRSEDQGSWFQLPRGFQADFDQYLSRDGSDNDNDERPLPAVPDTPTPDAGDKDTDSPRAHLDDFRM